MHFPNSFVDEIRNRLSPSDVIGRKIKLTHKGGGEYSGVCCFHNEKTPSFTVSNPKGFYHCFGCGAHGDIVKFVMESEGYNFVETVKLLAGEANLKIPEQSQTAREQHKKITTLYDTTEEACSWYENQLSLPRNSYAKEYLKNRGISEETIKTFRLGFAPKSKNSLRNAMVKKSYTEKQLLESGLIFQKEGKESYDRFRNRIIFPICNSNGKVIAFGGRIIGDGQPKYLNSPETELFHKGHTLYAFHNARETAYKKQSIVAVEGYIDVIALYQAGIKNAVAPLGTAITDEHIKIMWKVAKEPVICLDGDEAGMRAMQKTALKHLHLLKPGYSLSFSKLPENMDPDDIIKHKGVDALKKILGNNIPLVDAIWKTQTTNINLDTPEKKAELQSNINNIVEEITDQSIKGFYKQHYNSLMWEINREKKSWKPNKDKEKQVINVNIKNTSAILNKLQNLEATMILTVINNPELMNNPNIEDDFISLEISHKSIYEMHQELVYFFSNNEDIKNEDITEELKRIFNKNKHKDFLNQISSNNFIDNSLSNMESDSMAIKFWQYIYSQHQLCILENEYERMFSDSNNFNEEVMWGIIQDKERIATIAEKAKEIYQEALD